MAPSSQRPFVFLQTKFRQGVQPTTTFDIRLFGAIEIRRDGELLTNFRSQKALVLLAYLICENLAVTRDYLAGLAWPEMEQSQALGLLRRSLHDLSNQLPGCLEIDRRTVRFSPTAPVSIDIHGLTNLLIAPNDIDACAAAAAFLRAPFLHGIYVDDAPELEHWLLREQEHWQQAATRVLQRLIQQHTEESAYSLALLYVQQLLALEPWREEAQRQAMLLLARTGQASAALVQYATCRQILHDELGVEPASETELLYARIKAMAAAPPAHLPLTTTGFVGREKELAELRLLLAESDCRLITIIGAGGMGKTRLALEVARIVTGDDKRMFLHGATFAALASVDTADQLVAVLAQALAFTFQAQGDPETQLLNYLKTKEILLVLDNFEHLISERTLAFVLKLGKAAPDVKMVITSRTRLNLQSEQLYWMQGLHFPATASTAPVPGIEEIAAYSGIQLFLLTTQRTQPQYTLAADHVPALVTICQLVQGMPLAIELAAAWMGVLAPPEIAVELAHNLDFLSSEEHDLPLRQRSMRAVFDTSWRLLTPPEQSVYQNLSVTNPTDTHLQFVYAKVLARYGTFVDILRRRAEARKLLQASLGYFSLPALAGIDTRALCALILGWLGDTFHGDEAQQYYTQALALSQSVGAARHLAEMLLSQSHTMITIRPDTYSAAKQLAEDALDIHYRLDDKTGIAWSLHTLSRLALHQGDYRRCEQMSRESLAIHQQLEQRDGVAHTLGLLVGAMLLAGRFEVAQKYAQEALAIWTDLGFQGNALEAELVLGVALLHQGDYAAARLLAEKSLSSAHESGRREEVAALLGLRGQAALAQEQTMEAQRYFQESLKCCQDLSRGSDIACTLAYVVLTAYHLGKQTAAREYLFEAIQCTMGMQPFAVSLQLLTVATLLLADAGQITQATILYERTARQPLVANSRWLMDLVGLRLESLLGPLSSSEDDSCQQTSDPDVWKMFVCQLHTDVIALGWGKVTAED